MSGILNAIQNTRDDDKEREHTSNYTKDERPVRC